MAIPQILFKSLRALKHNLTEQRQRHQQTEWKTKQQQQVGDGDNVDDHRAHTLDEYDCDQRLSFDHQITAMEHCTMAIETLLLQDKLPPVVSSLTHFQEWLLKPPVEEIYNDPYEHLCTDNDSVVE